MNKYIIRTSIKGPVFANLSSMDYFTNPDEMLKFIKRFLLKDEFTLLIRNYLTYEELMDINKNGNLENYLKDIENNKLYKYEIFQNMKELLKLINDSECNNEDKLSSIINIIKYNNEKLNDKHGYIFNIELFNQLI